MTNRPTTINSGTAALNTAVLEAIERLENSTAQVSIRLSDVVAELSSVHGQGAHTERDVDRALHYLKGSKKAEYLRKSDVVPNGLWGWVTVKTASRVRK